MDTIPNCGIVPARVLPAWSAWAAAIAFAGTVTWSHAQPGAWRPERTVEIVATAAAGGAGGFNHVNVGLVTKAAYWDAAFERLVQTEEWKNEVQQNGWTLDYAGSKQSPQRVAAIYQQLKGVLADAGLAKE